MPSTGLGLILSLLTMAKMAKVIRKTLMPEKYQSTSSLEYWPGKCFCVSRKPKNVTAKPTRKRGTVMASIFFQLQASGYLAR